MGLIIAGPGDHHKQRPTEPAGVPRRFGVGTLLVVTACYALLFSALCSLGAEPAWVLLITAFLTVVGVGQAVLFQGKRPRTASVVVGIGVYLLAAFGIGALGGFSLPRVFSPLQAVMLLVWLLFGAVLQGGTAGYLAGVFVAAVFLIMRGVTNAIRPNDPADPRPAASTVSPSRDTPIELTPADFTDRDALSDVAGSRARVEAKAGEPTKDLLPVPVNTAPADNLQTRSIEPVGVPRRFGVGPLLAVTASYAVLFGLLRALGGEPVLEDIPVAYVVIVPALFVTAVGIGQAVLFQGKKPRQASIVVGGSAGFLMSVYLLLSGSLRWFELQMLLGMLTFTTAAGAIVGYLSGALAGGVFLIMNWFTSARRAENAADS